MSTTAQKQFFASLATFARSTAALLDEMAGAETPMEKPAKAAEPKPAKAAKPAVVEPKVEEPTKPVAAAPTPAAAPAAANGADIATQARKAAKEYAEVYGREGLKEVLGKFTTGTLADVPAEKLGEFIAALKA